MGNVRDDYRKLREAAEKAMATDEGYAAWLCSSFPPATILDLFAEHDRYRQERDDLLASLREQGWPVPGGES